MNSSALVRSPLKISGSAPIVLSFWRTPATGGGTAAIGGGPGGGGPAGGGPSGGCPPGFGGFPPGFGRFPLGGLPLGAFCFLVALVLVLVPVTLICEGASVVWVADMVLTVRLTGEFRSVSGIGKSRVLTSSSSRSSVDSSPLEVGSAVGVVYSGEGARDGGGIGW